MIKDLNGIGYPRNAIYKYHLFENKPNLTFEYHQEIEPSEQYRDHAKFVIDSTGPALLPAGQYALCNICFLPHFPDSLLRNYSPWQKAAADSIVFEQLHFESHPAYALEYCSREGRQFFIDHQLKIRVVKINSR